MHTSKLHTTAKVISDIGSPTIVATLFLIGLPLIHPEISWAHAALATLFVTLIPTLALILMRHRGMVGDRHVTVRSQRGPIMAVAGLSIILGLVLLVLTSAEKQLFAEVGGIFLGLAVCSAITVFWKVSIHGAVATYVGLMATATIPLVGPVIALLFSSVIGWSRVQLGHHTPAQVLVGQAVGCAVYLAKVLLWGS
ncbi:hypothetical protein [Paeniglutamicibacter cryotolerans]|uniref:Membrane-associated phospholipid phosphatase n=1 Tax=Paeniglutamicibacter cryotolerans TaxID=670079 RepID=A0A839QM93_9MICC|nr:hypothetical protein [Paeniglutamicibacter cryotolerans]MBB2997548.1 membrane-associated phospholipid phosphatase [Paeniglutamicibacter cryotolerans]